MIIYNRTNNTLHLCDGVAWRTLAASGGVAATGASGQIQFSSGSGVLGADSNLVWDNTNKRLGVGTAIPQSSFEVRGNLALGTGAASSIRTSNTTAYLTIATSSTTNKRAAIQFQQNANPTYEMGVDTDLDNTNTFFIYDGIALARRLVVAPNGNVGIGTATPDQRLTVANPGQYTRLLIEQPFADSTGDWVDLGMTMFAGTQNLWPGINMFHARGSKSTPAATQSGDTLGQISFYGHSGSSHNYAVGIWAGAEQNFTSSAGGSFLKFDTTPMNSLTSAERMRITSSGDLFLYSGQAYKPGGGSWAATSDARLKDVDGPYKQGLESILRLNTVVYHYKKDNPRKEPFDKPYVGLIAQEVQKVTMSADGFYNLDTTPINFAVINAIKELKAENDNLRQEIEALKAAR
jgi:hypothetical protein